MSLVTLRWRFLIRPDRPMPHFWLRHKYQSRRLESDRSRDLCRGRGGINGDDPRRLHDAWSLIFLILRLFARIIKKDKEKCTKPFRKVHASEIERNSFSRIRGLFSIRLIRKRERLKNARVASMAYPDSRIFVAHVLHVLQPGISHAILLPRRFNIKQKNIPFASTPLSSSHSRGRSLSST